MGWSLLPTTSDECFLRKPQARHVAKVGSVGIATYSSIGDAEWVSLKHELLTSPSTAPLPPLSLFSPLSPLSTFGPISCSRAHSEPTQLPSFCCAPISEKSRSDDDDDDGGGG
eukprot:5091874-Pleurochrysis_carterae.AAC.1